MQPDDRARLSRIRHSLNDLAQEIQGLIPVFSEQTPFMKGTVDEQKRKCGKPGCRCTTGELHTSMILSRSKEGHTKLAAISSGYLKGYQGLAERYQRFRRAQARLGQICKTMASLIEELEKIRRGES